MGCTDWTLGGIPGFSIFGSMELVSTKPFYWKGKHHHPSDEEREARGKRLFVYRYNQGGEKNCQDNQSRPYPSLTNIRHQLETSKYCHDQFRELGLGDLVMVGKEWWRKHMKTLDLEGFPKAWISRGLREIHHVGDHMDGRMDTCLGYSAVLGAEIYKLIGELQEELREDQKKRSLDGWGRMDVKRQLEDSLCDARGEISNPGVSCGQVDLSFSNCSSRGGVPSCFPFSSQHWLSSGGDPWFDCKPGHCCQNQPHQQAYWTNASLLCLSVHKVVL